MMSWLYLGLAILTEVVGTVCMKLSQGFTRLLPAILMFVLYMISIVFMNLAIKHIDVGIVYAIWSGLGTVMIAAIGIIAFDEPLSVVKIISVALIIFGVVGLNLGGRTVP